MNKLFKRTIMLGLSLMLCVSCITPLASAANADDASNPVIELEYEEYISAQDHFTSLAKDGATLVIHVGEENEAAELARIASESTTPSDTLQAPMARGYGIPTRDYNINELGKKTIEGSSRYTLGYLFTSWNYVGCKAYEISLYNRYSSTLKVDIVPKGSTKSCLSYTVPAKSTVIRYTAEPSWYARFAVPCDVYGYEKRDI